MIHERVPLSLDLQAGLDCCCLALQLPGLWSALSSPEMVTHACSLIHCVRFILEASESKTSVGVCPLSLGPAVGSAGLVGDLLCRLCARCSVGTWDEKAGTNVGAALTSAPWRPHWGLTRTYVCGRFV